MITNVGQMTSPSSLVLSSESLLLLLWLVIPLFGVVRKKSV